MGGKFIHKISENAVLRFWFSYLAVLFLSSVICLVGFQEALSVVEENIVEENQQFLQQGTIKTDSMISDLYRIGMQLSLYTPLQQLSHVTTERNSDYYKIVRAVLDEFSDMSRYYDIPLTANTFIYLEGMDRVLYDNAVYPKSVFQLYPDKWGVSMEEWLAVCEDDKTSPHFSVTEDGQLFYAFPCLESMETKKKFGTIMFHISLEDIIKQMPFLDNFTEYSIFIWQNDTVLWQHDGLDKASFVEPVWADKTDVYRIKGHLVLSISPEKNGGLSYILVLPEQEAMVRLRQLRILFCVLIGIAILAGSGFAFFFSFRTGNPVNEIAHAVHGSNMPGYSTDLRNLSDSVARIVEEQKRDKPALQKTFFHNLLKASFVSQSEMEYMASRAGLTLTGTSYCAASLQFFPEIDLDCIDGQTVEEARILHGMAESRLRQSYEGQFWSYKCNTVVSLYIIELTNPEAREKMQEALKDVVSWLREQYHVNAYWGVGSICRDLMWFWKSAEEANMMLGIEDMGSPVRCYTDARLPEDSFYLPYSAEERLVQGLRAGDSAAVRNSLEVIWTENFVHRMLSHKQFQRLDRRLRSILSDQTDFLPENDGQLAELKELAAVRGGDKEKYFVRLQAICKQICENIICRKNQLRSEKMQAILEFIKDNFSDPDMGLAMVSEKFNISEGYLSVFFKTNMEFNFADYLEKMRIAEACRLLADGVLVAEVAERTGYNSVQSFRRAFKRVKGISPSSYRE